eukprot:SAG11_NODE_1063_length_5996_cov_2.201798_5_plen_151_part_00
MRFFLKNTHCSPRIMLLRVCVSQHKLTLHCADAFEALALPTAQQPRGGSLPGGSLLLQEGACWDLVLVTCMHLSVSLSPAFVRRLSLPCFRPSPLSPLLSSVAVSVSASVSTSASASLSALASAYSAPLCPQPCAYLHESLNCNLIIAHR